MADLLYFTTGCCWCGQATLLVPHAQVEYRRRCASAESAIVPDRELITQPMSRRWRGRGSAYAGASAPATF